MKHLKFTLLAIPFVLLTLSCSSDDDSGDTTDEISESIEQANDNRFLNPLIIGEWKGTDECVGNNCFNRAIEYDIITFNIKGDFINDRTDLATNGEIKNTFHFFNTNQFTISEVENDGSIYKTYQRITKITFGELVFEEFKDSDGEYPSDEIVTYTFRKNAD